MVREIEIKLRVRDRSALLLSLKRLGATIEGRVREWNVLFDTPGGWFRRTGSLLRLRTEAPAACAGTRAGQRRAVVTFKAPAPTGGRSRFKEKLETEASVRDPKKWVGALQSLRFRPGFEYEKYRSSFRLGGLHVALDETPIGEFLELEGPPEAIDRTARQLGYRPRDYIRGTYGDLYAEDCARHGRRARKMLFGA